jgi:guanyl-specific ribonuclease Sa
MVAATAAKAAAEEQEARAAGEISQTSFEISPKSFEISQKSFEMSQKSTVVLKNQPFRFQKSGVFFFTYEKLRSELTLTIFLKILKSLP